MTSGCVAECVVEDKIGDFVGNIENSGKFELKGLSKEDTVFVLCDSTKSDGDYGRYVEVSVQEVIDSPVDQIIDVLNGERKDVVLNGITRIVGYYSRVNNWNKSKVGELRDRVLSRKDGGYGFNGTPVDLNAYNDALATVDNL